MSRIPFTYNAYYDSDTFSVARESATKQGTLEVLQTQSEPYEAVVEAEGYSFHLLVGSHIGGKFLCIPNWHIGCELSDLDDFTWNRESLLNAGSVLEYNSVTAIVKALSIMCRYIEPEAVPFEDDDRLDIGSVSNLLDQMVMDIQHLELEVIRYRYKYSFHLKPPYSEYLRSEIFSSMGNRYGGDPVYDRYLSYKGMPVFEDAIDTPFHVRRKQRIAKGHDDYPDMYP